jgi:glutamate-1-semialdehyde 2,1-aminomutase
MTAQIKAHVENEYYRRTPRSRESFANAKQFLPGGETRSITSFRPYPIFVAEGRGCRLTDIDGNVYFDLLNNYTALVHGHAHPLINQAVIGRLEQGTGYAAPTLAQSRLAQLLTERVNSVERVRFCNSGTEATMFALRAAKAFTGRNKILKMEGGYHGTHDAALISVTPALHLAGPSDCPAAVSTVGSFRGVIDDVVVAPFNDIHSTGRIIERNGKELAAIIVEPVLGSAGMIPAHPAFLEFLRGQATEIGALLIFDEVVTLRLGYGGAQETYRIRPDLTSFGKFIGGGFPVGAFGGRADVMELFDSCKGTLTHSGTFNGNELTMAAGLIAMQLLTRAEIARINSLGERLRDGIRRICSSPTSQVRVTGMGSLLQLHFSNSNIQDYRSAATGDKALMHLLHLSLLNCGVFIAPRGLMCISTAISEGEIDEVSQLIGNAANEIAESVR